MTGAAGVERQLEARARTQHAIAFLGLRALDGGDLQELMDATVATVAELLDVELCKVLELLPEGRALRLRAGVGWRDGVVGQATVGTEQESQAGYTLSSSGPVVVDDLRVETRFSGPALLHEHGVISGVSVIIHGTSQPWGVFGVHSTRHRSFDEDDVSFVQSVANVLAAAIGRASTEEELRRSRDELAIILRGVTDGITVQDTTGRLVYANEMAARMTGFATVEELLAAPTREILGRYEMFDDSGNPFPLDRLPGRAAIQGRPGPETLLRFRVVATGEERWSLVSATPVLDLHGQPRFAINIFHDVTERKRTEQVQDFLAEATALLATDLEYEETLSRVAHIAVPFMADVCVFDIIQPDGAIRRIVAHPDPDTERLIHELITRHPIEPNHPAMHAIMDGVTTIFEDIDEPLVERIGMATERARIIGALGFRSVVVVPLASRGRQIGALSLTFADSGRRYSNADLPVVHELARRAATAVDNALLYYDAQQAAARLRALAGASHAFAAASLDLQVVLNTVAHSAGELIGDQCILRLLSDDGTLLPAVALYHPDPARLAVLTELMANEVQRADEGLVGGVVSSGNPVLIPSISLDELRAAITAGHRDDIEQVPLHSIVIVQVRVRERVIGTLGLGRERPGEPYTDADLLLLQELADRAGLAIENARLYREAQDAIRSREQFLSIASHELKTPLTSVKASAQLLDRRLRQEPIDRTRVEPLVRQLQSEISRLETLVLDLLDATRIQQGRLELRREPVDLVELARLAIGRFDSAAQRLPTHNLIVDAPVPVNASIDPGRIDQVITNLVSNALKYSPDGGDVCVTVRAVDGSAEFAVSDCGIGISTDEQATLFQPFARGDVARQSIGGTGLGLFISAEIVERHGGTIAVESVPGRGSNFTVRLPLDLPSGT